MNDLFGRREEALSRLASHFRISVTPQEIDSVVQGPVFREDAKNPGREFSWERRQEEFARVRQAHSSDVRSAEKFVVALLGDQYPLDRWNQDLF
jgi:hypothetical protein